MSKSLVGTKKVIAATFAILGCVAIVAMLLIASPYLSIRFGPFESSMLTATLIAIVIVGSAWGVHIRYLKMA
jgi:hypothetical protein